MRLVLFTVDEPVYTPILLDPFLRSGEHHVVAVFSGNAVLEWGRIRRRIPFFVRNLYPFCISVGDWFRFAAFKLKVMLRGHEKSRSLAAYLAQFNLKAQAIEDINAPETLSQLRSLNADAFLFCPFGKIARKEFLEIPRLGVFNVHLGKLPEYRGGLSAFWVLRLGDGQAGATMHRAVEAIDAGEIVSEVRLDVTTNSMHQLMLDTVRAMGPKIVEGLQAIENKVPPSIDLGGRPSRYMLYPTWGDWRAFYKRRCRLI